jgi:predicted dehydrogenase
MYIEALGGPYAGVGSIVAFCDTNATRRSHYAKVLDAAGAPAPAAYGADRFDRLLHEQQPDAVIVTSPDDTHAGYVVAALDAGCDVVVEKPLTTTLDSARAIADAARAATGSLVMTFNYRYSPRNSALRQVIADGAIGSVTSLHFEWMLDTVHGADYFRRWHRDKDRSGGLMVHKSSHHFDLVNWWIDDVPATVYAAGGLRFYGSENAAARGLGPRPARSTGDPSAADDPFALDLLGDNQLRSLYYDAEADDGYLRDRDVFGPGVTIEDNAAVLVTYAAGAVLSYSLNAHSPWEGYRVSVNGTHGRAELEVVERGFVLPAGAAGVVNRPAIDPSLAPDSPLARNIANIGNIRPAGQRLLVQRHWEAAREVAIPAGDGAHGGGDSQLLDDLFRPGAGPDPLRRRAGYVDGLRAVAVGLAANASLETGTAVRIADLSLPMGATGSG